MTSFFVQLLISEGESRNAYLHHYLREPMVEVGVPYRLLNCYS